MADDPISAIFEPVVSSLMDEVIEDAKKLNNQVKILIHFRKDFGDLCNQLEEMRIRLDEAFPSSSVQSGTARIVNNLYKIVQDAEDIIEDCQHEKGFCDCIFRLIVGRKIQDIKLRIQGLGIEDFGNQMDGSNGGNQAEESFFNNEAKGYSRALSSAPAENARHAMSYENRVSSWRRESIKRRLQPVDPLTVGFKDQIGSLEGMVLDVGEANIVGVHGMGGVGKTTLLKKVWNSDKVQKSYENDFLIWVTVSNGPPAWLRRTIAQEIRMKFKENWTEEEAKSQIFNHILKSKKRYLMVLDDVRATESEDLLSRLGVPVSNPEEANSKIVVTSRDENALRRINANMRLLKIDPLPENEGWKLFQNHAFGSNGSDLPPPEVEQIAKTIARACNGHPLALKAVGSAMAGRKRDPAQQWELASEKLFTLHPEIEQKIFQCLRSSYDALFPHLKLCFLYFAAFPENQILRTTDLTDLWIAEGVVREQSPPSPSRLAMGEGQIPWTDLQALGLLKLKTLIDRCMVETADVGSLNKVRTCKMHNMLRILAIRIVEKVERDEKFMFRPGRNLENFPSWEINKQYNQISLMYNQITSLPQHFECPGLRTLLLRHNKDLKVIPPSFLERIASLRLLDLSMTGIRSLPESLGRVKRLVYLNLSRTKLNRLPASITRLERLKSINLFECEELEYLPQDISKLYLLRYLNLRRCVRLKFLPYEISKIASLQNLIIDGCDLLEWKEENLMPESTASLIDLKTLTQLRYLSFVCRTTTIPDGLMSAFGKMERLELCRLQAETLPHDILHMKYLNDLRISRWERLIELLHGL